MKLFSFLSKIEIMETLDGGVAQGLLMRERLDAYLFYSLLLDESL